VYDFRMFRMEISMHIMWTAIALSGRNVDVIE
jgi:hypothetical protein